jgi:hypothetical protein
MRYNIKVKQQKKDEKLDADDRVDNPSGVHTVEAESVKEALDKFHATVPIACLEHFDIKIRRSPRETFVCPPLVINGPEGFGLHPESYKTLGEAIHAAACFPLRYVHRGYYAGVEGRIPLHELPSMMEVVIDDEDLDDEEGYEYEGELDTKRQEIVRELARRQHNVGDDLQIDPGAVVSEGDDNGCYVAAWIWVNFKGTALDKDLEEKDG